MALLVGVSVGMGVTPMWKHPLHNTQTQTRSTDTHAGPGPGQAARTLGYTHAIP